MAFDSLEPFGDRRADYRSALQTHHLMSALINEYQGEPTDFVPKFEEDEPQPDSKPTLQRLEDLGDTLING